MDLKHITGDIVSVARKAGAFIAEERRKFSPANIENKAKNDLVSYVDKTAENIIVGELSKLYPDFGFIAEENKELEKREYNWIIDPLDGTTNFIHNIPCYAVSIGLEHHSEILAGAVFEVSRQECFYAWKSGGAFLNDQPISVSECSKLSDSLIATGFPVNNFDQMKAVLASAEYFMRNTRGIRRIGSAASDLCFLACGRVDAFYEYNLNAWDVAAGIIIVKEAGGTVSDFSRGNNQLFGRQIMAASPNLFPQFSEIISEKFNSGG